MIKKITDKSFWSRVGKNARDMYKDMIFEKGKTAYGTKYLNGKYSADYKVKSLRDRFGKKGTLTSKDQPLPDKIVKYILKEYNKYIKKNSKNKTRHHRK